MNEQFRLSAKPGGCVIEFSFSRRLSRFSFRPGLRLIPLLSLGMHVGMLRK
jgi:hypothetical protein